MYRSADQAIPADTVDLTTSSIDEHDLSMSDEHASDAVLDDDGATDADTVVVHVALRPRRGSARRCLAGLAALAAAHPDVAVAVTGLGKDERTVRVTVGVELGPRAGVARFSPQAQAAYAFVSELFTTLYDHMPVYCAEPGPAECAAAAGLMASLGVGSAPADVPAVQHTFA
ncbi:hypothetical protein [Blastococcus sp. URHD0036]|uniref:hypothetical protein n=1 Tax=Blastococcus sp. URHD0036 TaxID=1380356 RepID=UPI00068FDADC|nr:hypothetical protein [Blastococcus sp. URHD0036]